MLEEDLQTFLNLLNRKKKRIVIKIKH